MQSKDELERWYSQADPWKYETTNDDAKRKQIILSKLSGKYKRALDIGAGEGFITKDLPATTIEAIEISDLAASRFPENVKRVHGPKGTYDLIIATGVFYDQYNWKQMHQWILDHASGTIVTSNIKSWEHPLPLTPVSETEFLYREYVQHLCVYYITSGKAQTTEQK